MDDKGKSKMTGNDHVQTTFHSHSKKNETVKEVWEDDAAVAVLRGWLNLGCRRDTSLFLSVSQAQVDPSSEVLTPDHQKLPRNADTGRDTNNFTVQTQPPTQLTKERTLVNLLLGDEDSDLPSYTENASSYSLPSRIEVPPMSLVDNSAAETAEMKHPSQVCHSENIVSGSSAGSGPQFSVAPVYTSASSIFPEPVAVEVACNRALVEPDQEVAYRPLNHSIQLFHIKGHVPSLSVDPVGSRFIQKMLDTATTEEITMLYKEIVPHVCTLARDAFANYVIQKLLEHGPPVDIRKLIRNLFGQVLGLSLDLYGCRVIQKAFEIGDIDQQIAMAKELGSNLLKCACDQHANHVVKKCIECVPAQCNRFLYTSLCGNVKILSTHPTGCRVVQKVLGFCKDPQILHALVKEIVECANELSADPFGNYVVQYIVEHGGPHNLGTIVSKLAGQIVHMSRQKHSSNVIEKCLIHGSYHDRQLIINEILYAGGARTSYHLLGMMVHRYANYVMQTMIGVADEWQFNIIIDLVRHNVGKLVRCTHGRHMIEQAEKLVNARAGLLSPIARPGLRS